jgi:hypothetical protein
MTAAPTLSPRARITAVVTSWADVSAGPGRRGEFAFKVDGHEIGHLHGDRSAHFFFPAELWESLAASGRIVEHPVFPGRHGPAARAIAGESDVQDVIALMRINYERITGVVPSEDAATAA